MSSTSRTPSPGQDTVPPAPMMITQPGQTGSPPRVAARGALSLPGISTAPGSILGVDTVAGPGVVASPRAVRAAGAEGFVPQSPRGAPGASHPQAPGGAAPTHPTPAHVSPSHSTATPASASPVPVAPKGTSPAAAGDGRGSAHEAPLSPASAVTRSPVSPPASAAKGTTPAPATPVAASPPPSAITLAPTPTLGTDSIGGVSAPSHATAYAPHVPGAAPGRAPAPAPAPMPVGSATPGAGGPLEESQALTRVYADPKHPTLVPTVSGSREHMLGFCGW